MATPIKIVGGSYRPRHAIAHKYGSALYVRLWHQSNDELSVWKSTDNGATWAQAGGTLYLGNGSTFYPGCGTADGSILYVSYWNSAGRCDIARYDMAADDWTSDITGPSVPFSQWNQVGVRSDGSLVLIYLHTEAIGMGFQRKWKYWTVATGSAELSTAWQTWTGTASDTQIGPVIIAADDSAHFFYRRSVSGSSAADIQLMHRRLSSGGTLSSEVVAADLYTDVIWNPRGGCQLTISGTDSTVYALTDGDAITDAPAVLHGAATAVPGSYSIHPSIATDMQGIAKIGTTAYGTWPVSQSVGEYTGVQIGTFNGTWGATTTVNDGASGEPTWTWWMISPLGSDALGFVLDDYDDEWPWFMRHPVGVGPAARYYAM